MASRVRKGDEVVVVSGKDKGVRGRILTVDRRRGRAIVSGANMVKRHQRAVPGRQEAAIVEREAALRLCKLMPICPSDDRPTRVRLQKTEKGTRRVSVRSGHAIETTAPSDS